MFLSYMVIMHCGYRHCKVVNNSHEFLHNIGKDDVREDIDAIVLLKKIIHTCESNLIIAYLI